MSTRRSATGGLPLALRHLRPALGPSLLVAAVVAVTVLIAVVTPAVLSRFADAELRARLAEVPDVSRALSGDSYFPISTDAPGTTAEVWAPVTEAVDAFRARLRAPARAGVGAPLLQVRTTDTPITAPGLPGRQVSLALVGDPGFDSRVQWIDGAPPQLDPTRITLDPDGTSTAPADAPPVPIGLSERAAAQLTAPVGTVLGPAPGYLVTGVYRPRDPVALAWRASAGLVEPGVRLSPDGTPTLVLAAVVSPRTPGTLGVLRDGTLRILLPVDADAWDAREAYRVDAQLRAATLRGIEVASPLGGVPEVVLLRTGATAAIDDALRRTAALQTTTALAAVGPFGVALLVLGLGVGAVLQRRRPTLEIASARGASERRMRGAAALETLVFCVPAAVVAAALVAVLLPGPLFPAGLAAGAVLALAPAATAAALARPGRGGIRGDLGGRITTASAARAFGAARRGRRRGRWVAEAAVLVAAGAVTATLLTRGTAQDAAALDPLLVAAPLLLALAVGVLVLRLYPLPLRAVQRALRRGRRAPALLGVARAVREPTVGLAAVLAILVGVSVGVLSSTLGGTVDDATRTAARTAVGADIRADLTLVVTGLGPDGTRIPRVTGLRDVAPVASQGLTPVGGSDAALLTAPTAALHRIRADLPPSAGRVPAGMDRLRDGAIPLVASRDLGRRVGETLRLGDRRAVVVGTVPDDAGLGPTQRWVLIDSRFTGRVVRSPSRPTLVLADAGDAAVVAGRFRAVLPQEAILTDAATGYRALRDTPSVASLSVMLAGASALAAGLSILAAVLAVLAAARVRDRSVAVLRVLGMSRAQLRRSLAAELVPVAVAVLAAGTGFGIGLAALVLGAIDLRPFTGGEAAPALVIAPLPLAAVLGAFLLLAGGATAIAARASTRLTPADVIRADS